jgi:NAD(P)-dependent dehydrogenase (short-subunit alcohol dehydrogenase family)
VRFSITETTARVYFKVWEMACFSGFLMGREVAKAMLPHDRGTIICTGATASLRGREGFAAFAGAKHALRALAQSMARELWPRGIHVAHPVIDGAIDTEFIRSNFPERYALKAQQGILNPEHIADLYWQIHCQPRNAWTHETELRPWLETWRSQREPYPGKPAHEREHRVPIRLRQPQAFLCHELSSAIEARTGPHLRCLPVLLGGLSKPANNRPPAFPTSGRGSGWKWIASCAGTAWTRAASTRTLR